MRMTWHNLGIIQWGFTITFVVTICACSKSPVTKAQEFIDAGMYEQAKVVLSDAILADPKNANLHFLLGQCLLKGHDINHAQEFFNQAIRLNAGYGKFIGNAYYDQAVISPDESDRESLFSLAKRYDPSINTKIARVYMNEAISKIDDSIEVTTKLATSAVSYNPAVAKEIAATIFSKATSQPLNTRHFTHLEALSELCVHLDSSAKPAWARLFFEKLSSNQAIKDPSTTLSIGVAAAALDASLQQKIAMFYREVALSALLPQTQDPNIATTFFSAATSLDPTLKPRVAEIVWAHLDAAFTSLKTLGAKGFSDLFTFCGESDVPEAVRNSGRYRFARALKAWADGLRTSAIEQLTMIASSGGDSFEVKKAREILAPPEIGKRSIQSTLFHFKTWAFGPGRGQGVDIQLVSFDIQSEQISLSFSVKCGDHKDLLLYAPQNIKERFGSNCEALYVLDDNGRKFYGSL